MTDEKRTAAAYEARIRAAETENRRLKWKLLLNEAASRTFSMHDVIIALAGIIAGAVFLLDRDMNVILFDGSSCLHSCIVRELLKTDALRDAGNAALVQQAEKSPQGAVLENGDICYAACILIGSAEPFYLLLLRQDSAMEADIPFLTETVKHCLTTVDQYKKRGAVPFDELKMLMSLIINRQLQEWDEIETYMKRLPNPPKQFMCIAVVRIDASRYNAINVSTFISKLKIFFPECSVTLYEDSFVLLISSDDKTSIQPRPVFNERAFSVFLSDHDAHAAFSNATQRMDMIRTMYLLADATLRLGRDMKANQQQRILYYENYADYVLMELAFDRYKTVMGHDDLIFLINPHAVQLYHRDICSGTDLHTVLFNYCLYNGNGSAAAKASFMHRNTFAAKIAEIRTLIPEDLDDALTQQRMLFSCRMLQFIAQHYDKKSPLSMTDRLNVVVIRERNYRQETEDTGA